MLQKTGSLMSKNNHKNNTVKKDFRSMPGELQLFVSNGTFEGEVNLQWDAMKEANRYIIQVSKNGTGWQQIDIVSDPQYSLSGLRSGRTYCFRISALYRSGQGPWSNPVMKKVK